MGGRRDKVQGASTSFKGKLQQAAGELTRNRRLKAKGATNEARGNTRRSVGVIKRALGHLR